MTPTHHNCCNNFSFSFTTCSEVRTRVSPIVCLDACLPPSIPTYLHPYRPTSIHTDLLPSIHTDLPPSIHTNLSTYHPSQSTYIPLSIHTNLPTSIYTNLSTYLPSIHPSQPTYLYPSIHTNLPTYLPTSIHPYQPTYLTTHMCLACFIFTFLSPSLDRLNTSQDCNWFINFERRWRSKRQK